MIAATVGMVFTAFLFVVFGALALADRGSGCHSHCGSCAVGTCDNDRHPSTDEPSTNPIPKGRHA